MNECNQISLECCACIEQPAMRRDWRVGARITLALVCFVVCVAIVAVKA